jgi:hypothetical protein
MFARSSQVLSFKAKFVPGHPEDLHRQFVVSYYLADASMSIFEEVVPNSGFRGGKFLQRTRVSDLTGGHSLGPRSFYIGAVIQCSGRAFELVDAAPRTLEVMEGLEKDCPEANPNAVAKNIVSIALPDGRSVRDLFEASDPGKTGYVKIDQA